MLEQMLKRRRLDYTYVIFALQTKSHNDLQLYVFMAAYK